MKQRIRSWAKFLQARGHSRVFCFAPHQPGIGASFPMYLWKGARPNEMVDQPTPNYTDRDKTVNGLRGIIVGSLAVSCKAPSINREEVDTFINQRDDIVAVLWMCNWVICCDVNGFGIKHELRLRTRGRTAVIESATLRPNDQCVRRMNVADSVDVRIQTQCNHWSSDWKSIYLRRPGRRTWDDHRCGKRQPCRIRADPIPLRHAVTAVALSDRCNI